MKERYIFTLIVFVYFVIFGNKINVFAFTGGILNGNSVYIGTHQFDVYSTTNKLTDNDINTGFTFSSSINTFWILTNNISVDSVILKVSNNNGLTVNFYDSVGNIKYQEYIIGDGTKKQLRSIVRNVYKISVTPNSRTVYEFDVFYSSDTVAPSEIKNLQVSVTDKTINLNFTNPTDVDFNGTKLYLNGVLKATLDKTKTSYSFVNLVPNTRYTIKVTTFDTSNNESNGVTTTVKTLPPPDVAELKLFPSAYSILAQWINPTDSGFIGNDLYLNGNFITSLDKDATSYNFTNLNPNTSYTVKVVSKFIDGYSSTGQTATAKTTIPVEDVADLQADAKYDRVKLSWTRPNSEFFSHVKIYRKNVERKSFWDQLFGTTSVSAENTSDGYTPMFETNGTYWTDLTVTPETTYSYKVTSVNIEGNESQGVTVETTTPSEPVPVLSGVATTQNENGDYVVTWASPTKGIVKVLIDGKEYAQVDAATKQIVIKKEDMKTDFFGAYAATLIPIGEYGTKGQAVNVPSLGGKIDFPLSFQDFLETTISILAWVAPFILLSLMFIFWRPIFNFIKKVISNERRVKQ